MYGYERRKNILSKAGPGLLAVVLIWLALGGLFPAAALGYGGGDGSDEDNAYEISTVAHLLQLRADATAGATNGIHYKLMNDLDLGGVGNWEPIGDNSTPFKGVFHGNNQVIRNMNIACAGMSFGGLFGYTNPDAIIENLSLENMNINFTSGGTYTGGLVGTNEGTVSNCHVIGSVYANPQYAICIGGLAGRNTGSISGSDFSGSVTGTTIVGGLVGVNYLGSISSSHAAGSVSATHYASGEAAVGGLVGVNSGGSISSSYSTCGVSGEGEGAGGLVGGNGSDDNKYGTISNCYATGDVRNTGEGTGGLVGGNDAGCSITNCYATGSVESSGNGIGGLVGAHSGALGNSYALNDSEHQLIGYNVGTVTGSSLENSAQMKQQDTFAGWDFGPADPVWAIHEGRGYPYLTGVTAGPVAAATDPADGAVNVSPDKTISVTFGENIQAGTDIEQITINGVIADYDYSINGYILTIDPTTDLDGGVCAVTIPAAAVEGLQAVPMETDYGFSFTTVPAASIASTVPTTLNEAAANDGSLSSGTIAITIANGTLAADITKENVTAANLPAGLDYTVTRDSDTQLTITVTGKATNHADANDVSNLNFTIAKDKVTGATGNLTTENIRIDFNDPAAPAAPTNPVVDDNNNTFGWTNVPGFEDISSYEYSVNSGATWQNCMANPQPIGNVAYAAGVVQVRVKADSAIDRPAGAALLSDKPYTVASQSGGASGGGDDSPPSNSLSPATIIIVDSIFINGQTTTTAAGTVETFTIQAGASGQITTNKTELTTLIQINVNSSQTAVTGVNIPAAVLASAADLNVSISTPNATLELPAALVNALAQAGQSLSLTVTRGGEVTNPVDTAVLGTPTTINTDIVGTTQVTIPLAGIAIPSDPLEREAFLAGLAVFTLHSDGEQQIINGEIIYDAGGNPVGITFPVDKFSTFAIVKLSKRTVTLTLDRNSALINGIPYTLDASPFVDTKVNKTLAPLRFIGEALGAKVEWLPATRQVRITDGAKEIIMTLDATDVLLNGVKTQTNCAPVIAPPGRTFLPLRFVSETLGAQVTYDEATRRISIIREYGR